MLMLMSVFRSFFRLCFLLLATGLPLGSASAAQDIGEDASVRYEKAAEGCAEGNANNCHSALSLYARDISNDDIGPVIAMLSEHCIAEIVTGCSALASVYGSFESSSVEGTIRIGIDEPQLRDAALQTGCAQVLVTYNTCGELAGLLVEAGDIAAASVVYDRGCGYVRGLAAADRNYINNWDCYNAAKHALLQADDYARAQRDF